MNDAQLEYIYKDLESSFSQFEGIEKLKNKKIFITGASGFIGKWLLLFLSYLNNKFDLNISIIASSRRMTHSSILSRLKQRNIEFLDLDVRVPFDITADVNIILHLAGQPDRRVHASDPLSVIKTNVDGTRHVLDAASRLENLNSILVFSSGLISGSKVTLINPEDKTNHIETLNFNASYYDSKRLQENICHIFSRTLQLPIGIVRPYTFVGPLQKLDRPWAINNFISNAINGRDIKILGDPETNKSFLYPTEMLKQIFYYLCTADFDVPLELGSSDKISLIDMASIISNESGCHVKLTIQNSTVCLDKKDFYVSKNKETHMSYENIIRKSLCWYNL